MRSILVLAASALLCVQAHAAVGQDQIPASADDGPITLFYPTADPEQTVRRGVFDLVLAPQAAPVRGNGRLVVISHGSGGSPWVFADLARSLVEAGFVVALPEHCGDNARDPSNPGPDSWARRPAEVSRAIDAVGREPRFAPLLQLDRVGVHGFSAGGHTALSMAGGRWSKDAFRQHCDAELEADFQACVGLLTRLTGGPLDGIKKWGAATVIRHRFSDPTLLQHSDPRVAAVVAAAPWAADFEPESLAAPAVPLGLVTLGQDRWLPPRLHSDRVLQGCSSCELVAALPTAGHGAMLSPLPDIFSGLQGDMLNDPPGFDRSLLPAVHGRIADFFGRHLLR
jgi:predicted dienelactone hydrolase